MTRHAEITRHTPFPKEAVYDWYTSFSPEDVSINPILQERRVERLGQHRLRVISQVKDGPLKFPLLFDITLHPKDSYDVDMEAPMFSATAKYEFSQESDGTTIHFSGDFRIKGFYRLLAPFFARDVVKSFQDSMTRFVKACEIDLAKSGLGPVI